MAYAEFELGSEGDPAEPIEGPYFDLQWVPGCNREQPLALIGSGQWGCGQDVERRDKAWLTDELRELGILQNDEWLEVVPLAPPGRQALAVRSQASDQSGWIRVGDTSPGSVWRTTYYPPGRRVGMRCWLGIDYTWLCEE